jgi:hypothetical protein
MLPNHDVLHMRDEAERETMVTFAQGGCNEEYSPIRS